MKECLKKDIILEIICSETEIVWRDGYEHSRRRSQTMWTRLSVSEIIGILTRENIKLCRVNNPHFKWKHARNVFLRFSLGDFIVECIKVLFVHSLSVRERILEQSSANK